MSMPLSAQLNNITLYHSTSNYFKEENPWNYCNTCDDIPRFDNKFKEHGHDFGHFPYFLYFYVTSWALNPSKGPSISSDVTVTI